MVSETVNPYYFSLNELSIVLTGSTQDLRQELMEKVDDLVYQTHILNDQVNVLLAWENLSPAAIRPNLSIEELIKLHQIEPEYLFEDFSLVKSGKLHLLRLCGKLKLAFNLCSHGVYTPIDMQNKKKINSECPLCF